jgi:uncharacterized protein YbbC (DUF1343 family)
MIVRYLLLVVAVAGVLGSGSCARAQVTSGVLQQLDAVVTAAQGKRIGMMTNPSGCDEAGALDADYLIHASGTTVTAFFAPEHGLRGDNMTSGDYIDPQTSIPVYAVYGSRNAPTDAQLATVDILVFDLQDVGVRFYTFQWTMTYSMEAAARNAKPFYVIDRPNPIGGLRAEGAPNTVDYGVVGRLGPGAAFGVSARHGLTVGELATMWNTEWMSPKADLHVIRIPGWERWMWWTDTGRVFVRPSPNMRTPAAATVYPGTCIFEGSNVSEGRGTDMPFEKIGAPFINATAYANALTSLSLPGVQFTPVSFTPTSSDWTGQLCGGVQLTVIDRDAFDPIRTGMYMLKIAYQLYPSRVTITSYAGDLMGVPNLQNRIKTESVDTIIAGWQANLALYRTLRSGYLLYPDGPSRVTDWELY